MAQGTASNTATQNKARAPRDPERRKRQIAEAAAAIIAQGGGQHLTHRRVADEAGVPLGSTTHYFKNIDDLRHAGLACLAQEIERRNQEMLEQIDGKEVGIDLLCDFAATYLSDREQVKSDARFYAAAVNDPQVNGLWQHILERYARKYAAERHDERLNMASAFLTGLVMDTAINDASYDKNAIRKAMRALLDD